MNDMYDTLPDHRKNDRISLIYESNLKTLVSVNTPFGLTERKEVNRKVEQGGIWGPIKCSNSVDTIGKECELKDKHLYKYKSKSEKLKPNNGIDDNDDDSIGIERDNLTIYKQLKMEP